EDYAVGERVGGGDAVAGREDADHGELEDSDVRWCRREDRGDVDGEQDRAAAADPDRAVESHGDREGVTGGDLDPPGEELHRRGQRRPARVAEDGEAGAYADEPIAQHRGGAGGPPGAAAADQRRRGDDRDEQDRRREADEEQVLGGPVEEIGRADDDDAEQDQGGGGEDGVRDQGAEQARERLAEPADPAGDDHRPRGLADPSR